MGGLLGDIFGTARDIRRGTREIGGVFREVGRTSDEIARARGAVEGHGGVKDEAEYRREERGDRSFSRAARARAEREAIENGNDGRDDRRGGRDDDRRPGRGDRDRAAYLEGNGGKGPRNLGSGQTRDDGYEAPSRDRMEQATKDYVFALADAALSPAGSPERALAIKEARDILTDPQNGLMPDGPEGAVRFPEGMRVVLDGRGRDARGIHFEGMYSRAPSADESIRRGVSAVAEKGIGSPLTDADIAALRGASAPTVAVGTGEQPKPTTPEAPAQGAAKPDAPGAASFALPEASGPAAKIYTKNGEGRTMNAEDAPKISASQVKAIQEKLNVKADEMWGPNTQAAFAAAAAKAGVKPSDVDFTNPNDPDTIKIMAHFNAGASPAAGAAVTAAPAAATEAERLTTAAAHLTQLAGENKTLTADDIAVMGQDKAAVETTAKTFDLNGNGSVEQTELDKIVAAANGLDIQGGAATLAPMFAGVTVPATGVAESIQYVSNPVVQPLQSAAEQGAGGVGTVLKRLADAQAAAPQTRVTEDQINEVIEAAKASGEKLEVTHHGDGKYSIGAGGNAAPVTLALNLDAVLKFENAGLNVMASLVDSPEAKKLETVVYESGPASQTASQMIAALDTTKPVTAQMIEPILAQLEAEGGKLTPAALAPVDGKVRLQVNGESVGPVVTPTDETMFVLRQSGLVNEPSAQAANAATVTQAAAQPPSSLFAQSGFTPAQQENLLVSAGFNGVNKDGIMSEQEKVMANKLFTTAGLTDVVDQREQVSTLNAAAVAAKNSGTTLAAKAEAGEVYSPTSHEFTAAPPTPDARTQAQRENAMAGSRA